MTLASYKKKNSNYFYTKHTEIKQTEKQKSRELENLFVLLKKKEKELKKAPLKTRVASLGRKTAGRVENLRDDKARSLSSRATRS